MIEAALHNVEAFIGGPAALPRGEHRPEPVPSRVSRRGPGV